MMCARLLKHTPEKQSRFYRMTGDWFDRVIARYGQALDWVLDRQPRDAARSRSPRSR